MSIAFDDISAFAFSLLAVLLVFEYLRPPPIVILTAKVPLSLLFCYVALTSATFPSENVYVAYRTCILYGLLCGLAGDVALAFIHSDRLFLVGLVVFLAGHVMYVFAFAFLCVSSAGDFAFVWKEEPLMNSAVMGVLSLILYLVLMEHFGPMRLPCLAYIVVITLMVAAANYLYFDSSYKREGREMALYGAVLFFISDLFVACEKFVYHSFLNRLLNLPTYYAAQFLIAYSISSLFAH